MTALVRSESARLQCRAAAEVLRAERSAIVQRWVDRVLAEERIPKANELSRPELVDHVPLLVDGIIEALETDKPRARESSTCAKPFAAMQHGALRAREGYDVFAALCELSAFRKVLIDQFGAMGGLDTDASWIVHSAIDDAVGTAAAEMHGSLIAEMTRQRDTAREADENKARFLALLSHEVRNALNSVLGWAQLAKDNPVRVPRALEVIERNGISLKRLVDDMLDLDRARVGKMQLARQTIDLRESARAAARAATPLAELAGIALHGPAPGDPLWVRADPARLDQVFSNLIQNSIKFTPRGGAIHVEAERRAWHAEVSVQDTGAGIAAEDLQRLFTPYAQGRSGADRESGIGVGLALVREIIDAHDGDVHAESAGVGRGATFRVRLPIGEPPAIPPPSAR